MELKHCRQHVAPGTALPKSSDRASNFKIMTRLYTFILVVQLLSSVMTVALVLLSQGKGAQAGVGSSSADSGSSVVTGSTVVGRLTAGLIAVFFLSTLCLAWVGNTDSAKQTLEASSLPMSSSVVAPSTPTLPAGAPHEN